jgi:hypothetical protein
MLRRRKRKFFKRRKHLLRQAGRNGCSFAEAAIVQRSKT